MNISMLAAQQIGATQIVLWVVLGLMLVALLVYPMITRKRQARDFEAMVNNLSVGDKVMTNIGMIGTIKKIMKKEDGATFLLETGEKTVIELDVGAIARILYSVKPAPTAAKVKKEEPKAKKEIKVSESAIAVCMALFAMFLYSSLVSLLSK